jgi:multicomponent Na+:H+ antiporter subunit F
MTIENVALLIVLPALSLTLILTVVRLIRGPSVPDRVVALDLLASVGIAIAAVYGMMTDQPAFADVAIVLALLSFLGTVAFARYVERGR